MKTSQKQFPQASWNKLNCFTKQTLVTSLLVEITSTILLGPSDYERSGVETNIHVYYAYVRQTTRELRQDWPALLLLASLSLNMPASTCHPQHAATGELLSQERACPKSEPVPRVGLSQGWACPKSGPVPRVGLSQEWACPKSGPVPSISFGNPVSSISFGKTRRSLRRSWHTPCGTHPVQYTPRAVHTPCGTHPVHILRCDGFILIRFGQST